MQGEEIGVPERASVFLDGSVGGYGTQYVSLIVVFDGAASDGVRNSQHSSADGAEETQSEH